MEYIKSKKGECPLCQSFDCRQQGVGSGFIMYYICNRCTTTYYLDVSDIALITDRQVKQKVRGINE